MNEQKKRDKAISGRKKAISKKSSSASNKLTKRHRVQSFPNSDLIDYKNLYQTSSCENFLHDFEGKILDLNLKAKQHFGILQKKSNNFKLWDLFSEDSLPIARKSYKKLGQNGEVQFEVNLKASRNGTNPVKVTAKVIEMGGKKIVQSVIWDLSEVKSTEKKHRESEILTNSIIKSVPDIIYRLDTKGKIVFINDSVQEYGYKPSELIGRDIFDLVHPEDREKAVWRVNERRTGERKTKSFEIRLLAKSKKIISFDIRSKSIYADPIFLLDAEGLYSTVQPQTDSFIGTQGVARDITQRKISELALKASEEKFRSIVENSHVGICIINDDFKITYVNHTLLRLLRYTKKELIDHDFRLFLSKKNVKVLTDRYLKRQKGERVPAKYELELQRKDGKILIVELIATIIKTSSGNYRTVAQFLDITERRQSEKIITESENKFRQVFQNANDAIYLLEINKNGKPGSFLEVNDRACEMLGYTREELLEMGLKEIDAKEEASKVDRILEKLYGKRHITFESTHVSKSGHYIPVEISSHFFNLNGKKVVLSIARDITDRKLAEKALKESQEKLGSVINHAPVVIWAIDKNGKFTFSDGRGLQKLGLKPGEVVGKSVFEIYGDNKNIISNTKKSLKGKDIFTTTNVGNLTYETQYAPLLNEKKEIIGATGIAIDITERVKSTQRLHQKNLQQEKLLETARQLTESLELNEVLTRIAHGATEILKADGCTIYLLDQDNSILKPVVCIDPNYEKEILCTNLSIDTSFTGKAIKAKRGLIFNDAGNIEDGQQIPGTPEEEEENIIVAPFIVNKMVLGAMCLTRLEEIFYDEDLFIAETFAVYAATALKNAQIHSELTHEIEERIYTENALKYSEEKFRNLAEKSPNMIFINYQGKIVYANRKCEEIMGYTRMEFYSSKFKFHKLIAPESMDKIKTNFSKHLNGEDIPPYEYTLLTKSGKIIEALITTKLINYEGKQAILGLVTDIGVQKKAEEALKNSEEKYRRFFEDDLTGDFITNADGKLIACNSAFLRIFGFASEDEAFKFNLEKLFPNEDGKKSFYETLMKERMIEYHEMELHRCDGKPVYVIANVSGKFNINGDLQEIKGYIFDDTERKILEQQFRQSQKMEAVGRLAGGVAHDFNNLLTIIKGYSEIILNQLRPEDSLYKDINQIRLAGDKAASLTNQLLAFSRRQVMKPKLINLNTVITDLENMLERLIGEDIELQTFLDPHIEYIKADPSQLEQVIMNLAVNARDAMPKGGKLIVETKNIDLERGIYQHHIAIQPPGEYVLLSISDTGIGIDKETQARIFEPFFTTKDRGKGTGLGLSTVYGIIKQSGGFIWVYSEPNQGTTFKIYFPRVTASLKKKEITTSSIEDLQGHETVLLVEDEKMVRELTERILIEFGYKVLVAENGEEAKKIFEKNKDRIQIIVTDIVMPGISGRDMVVQLSKIKPDVKVLYISGYSDEAILHQNKIDSGSEFLQKPFNAHKLVHRIRKILDGKS